MAILITGGYGCIGAETTRWLLRQTDQSVVVASRSVNEDRTDRVFDGCDRTRLTLAALDVQDSKAIADLLRRHEVDAVVHLAGLQTPDCNAHRDLGLQVNLAGTQNLIEAIKASGNSLNRFVYASSAAVYGPRAEYPQDRVDTDASPKPVNVYGVWKLAAEHVTRIFHEETGIPSLSIRPAVLFGPGRDAGLTASPTTAMKCVALGLPYTIPFHSRQDYLFAPDVGAAFGHALLEPFTAGYSAFNLPSHTATTRQFVDTLVEAATEADMPGADQIQVGERTVPFICDLDASSFMESFPNAPLTSLRSAIRQSLETFRDQARRGWLSESDLKRDC